MKKEAIIHAAQQTQLKLPLLTVKRIEIILTTVRRFVSFIQLSQYKRAL